MSPRDPQIVTTVDLPSGKVLEVVQPAGGEPYTRVQRTTVEDRKLWMCGACGSDLVEPSDWEAAGHEMWRVTLRCPNCETWSEGVFSQDCVDRLDEKLDEAIEHIVGDLKRLQQATMTDDVERFIGALHAGAILPEDFQTAGPGITRP